MKIWDKYRVKPVHLDARRKMECEGTQDFIAGLRRTDYVSKRLGIDRPWRSVLRVGVCRVTAQQEFT